MATLGSTNTQLTDLAQTQGADQVALVNALTAQRHGTSFRVLPFKEVKGWTEKFRRMESRPTVSWRNIGGTVTSAKAQTQPYSESLFLASALSEVDKITADNDARGPKVYRGEQDDAYLESMGYQLSYGLYYGSNDTDQTVDGLLHRLPVGGDAVVNAGATSETTSIYALRLGPGQFMGLWNAVSAGKVIQATDYGPKVDSGNEIYETFFNMAVGFAQYHPLSIGRIAKCNATTGLVTNQDFFNLFSQMEGRPDLLVTSWLGLGYIAELKKTALQMNPNDKNYDAIADHMMGVPIIVDTVLSDAENGITV